jgi:hypothetical protein
LAVSRGMVHTCERGGIIDLWESNHQIDQSINQSIL